MSRVPMTEMIANRVYSILVTHVGANEYGRESFICLQSTERCPEYRFQGSLGFGGKFRRANQKWYVDCYQEDFTKSREMLIDLANIELAFVYAEQVPVTNVVFRSDGLVDIDDKVAISHDEARRYAFQIYGDFPEHLQVLLETLEKGIDEALRR